MLGNILEQEDIIKGLPDDYLYAEAEQPSGQLPPFLVVSEIQRRTDMRERYEATQDQPQGTITQQIVAEGLGGMSPMDMASQTMGSPIPADPTSQVPVVAATGAFPDGAMAIGDSGLAGMGGQPQMVAGGGRVGMFPGGTAGGGSNMVAAVNAAIDKLRAEGRDPSAYSQYELRIMGEEILGTDRPPTLQQQGYRQQRSDLGADYEPQSMDYGLLSYDPDALSNRAIDAVAGLGRPSGASEAGRRIERGEQERYGAEAEQRGRDVAQFIREDEQLGILGGVARGAGDIVADAYRKYIRDPYESAERSLAEVTSPLEGGGISEEQRNETARMENALANLNLRPGGDEYFQIDDEMAALANYEPEEGTQTIAETPPYTGDGYFHIDDELAALANYEPEEGSIPEEFLRPKVDAGNIAAIADQLEREAQLIGPPTEDEILSVGDLLGEDFGKNLPLGTGDAELADALSKRTPSALETDLARGYLDKMETLTAEDVAAEESIVADYRDRIERSQQQARDDAFNAWLGHFGAGVAGGDLQGGLERGTGAIGDIKKESRATTLALEEGIVASERSRRKTAVDALKSMADIDVNFLKLANEVSRENGLMDRSDDDKQIALMNLIGDLMPDTTIATPSEIETNLTTMFNAVAHLFGLPQVSTTGGGGGGVGAPPDIAGLSDSKYRM
jgi:hypothetical protein